MASVLVTLTLSGEEMAAARWVAQKRNSSVEAVLTSWLRPTLISHQRLWREHQWAVRRQVLESDATLAATVDSAAKDA